MQVQALEEQILHQVQISPKLSKLSGTEMLCFSVTGLNEEAGEVAGLLCREVYKKYDMPQEKWLEELGDVLWYLIVATHAKGFSLTELFEYNTQKLMERYGELREHE